MVAQHYVLGLAALSQHIQTISLSHNKDSNQKIRFFVCGPYCTCNNVKDDAMIVDQVIELLAVTYKPLFCNFHTSALCSDGAGWLPQLCMDKWHPNQSGHRVMANIFLESFRLWLFRLWLVHQVDFMYLRTLCMYVYIPIYMYVYHFFNICLLFFDTCSVLS